MGNFLKYTFASLIGTLLGLGVLFGVSIGGAILLLVAATNSDGEPKIEPKSVLVLDLSVAIAESQPVVSTAEALSEALAERDAPLSIGLRRVTQSISKAAKDDRIVAMYIQGRTGGTSNGWATLKEVRAALEEFRASGKKIFAYDMDWSENEYYLASAANTIVLNPQGIMEINGFASEGMFFAGALQKYGIGVQVTRVGKYKSAVEPFLLTQRSAENRQQTQQLLNDLWADFLGTVAQHRSVKAPQIQAIANQGGVLLATEARDRGLVDRVAYFDEVLAELKQLTGNESKTGTFRQISLPTYASTALKTTKPSQSSNEKPQITVIFADGEIVDGQGTIREVGGDRLAKELRTARLDDKIKAVVLRVNSPGGSATASEVISREVQLTAAVKPVVVSMGNFAASGGYWISTNATKIFAQPNTVTGSIGVFGLLLNVQKLASDNGITWDAVKTAPYADLETSSRPKTPQELAINQRIVDRIYDRFLEIVAAARKLPKASVAEIAQGRVWSGQEAKKLGLVDEQGGLQQAILAAAELAKLGDNWQIEDAPKPRRLEEKLLEKLLGVRTTARPTPLNPLIAEFEELQELAQILSSLNDPKAAYSRLPYQLKID
ncbi:signal peptide peptidase SppA [[Phormidium] sp. ETS-05]|uniref:signal peptide peptidase SppA n=1 Tax=[Phormidium] sp. ETS-05 TaxID=222819 RepID=UPI0018EEF37A|nr:signal peptide peptidase SppA [[Phormidium] sp. ETS-05]